MMIPIRTICRPMRGCCFFATCLAVVTLTSSSPAAMAEVTDLSEADRIALLEKLEVIEKRSDARVSGLYRRAIADYRSAIRSDDATMDLYLKCYEKIHYTDEKRKSQSFREWKRKNKDKLNSGSMRMALRHQLSWLLLSIEAAQREGDVSELGGRAMTHLDQIFKNADRLKQHRGVLSQNALGSVFAKAYDLNIKVEDWPTSALDIGKIYDKVVMPPLRKPEKITSLRSAWKRRILHEGLVREKWSPQPERKTIGKKDAMRSPALQKFLEDVRPQLFWKMEVDCFESGDEREAALRMLSHVEKYITHKNAPDWIEEFQELIKPSVGEVQELTDDEPDDYDPDEV